MKCTNQVFNKYALLYGACLFSSLMSTTIVSQAEEVVLNPGYINGGLGVGNLEVTNSSVTAFSSVDGDRASVAGVRGRYTLIVNTGQAGMNTYAIDATAYTDSNRDTMTFNRQFDIEVNSGEVTTVDFIVANPGFIQGTVTVNGSTILDGNLYANLNDATGYTNAHTKIQSDGAFHFPVQPNSFIVLNGNVRLTNGDRHTFERIVVDVAEGQTITQNYDITVAEKPTGTLSGVLDIPGQTLNSSQIIMTSGAYPNTTTRYYRQQGSGPYSVELESGLWNTILQFEVNNRDDRIQVPYHYFSRYVDVPSGGSAVNGIPLETAFVNGKIKFSGSVNEDVISAGHINFRGWGNSSGSAFGGLSRDEITASGEYDAVLTPGNWLSYWIGLTFDPSDEQYQSLAIHSLSSAPTLSSNVVTHTMVKDQVKNNVDLSFETGTMTIRYSNLGSQLISSPRFEGRCFKRNLSGDVEYGFIPNVNGRHRDVEFPSLKLIGLAGECDFTATGTVGGTRTTFGRFTATIHPGTDVVTDIGAPTLSVVSPKPETFTTEAELQVNGVVTDNDGVATITVNGADVPFVSTNNAQDPNEVEFGTTVALVSGENDIAVGVTDTLGNTLTETRNVYRDGADPIVNWVPADGSVVDSETVLVSGTATDDVSVTKITINGEEVILTSTNNPEDANEVSFSTTLTLVEGANPISVVVTDQVGRQVGNSHIVTFSIGNEAPIAHAGLDQLLECTGALTTANLDGSASIDADNDPLSYAWTGSFGAASGVNAAVQLALGTHLIDLTVDDGILSAMDQLSVMVQDTMAPVITLGANVTLEATSLNGAEHDLGVMVDDLCGTASYAITPNLASYPLGKTTVIVDANDDSQNTSTASIMIDVVDTTAPELSVPVDVTVIAAASLTTVDLGAATASDIFDVTVSNNLPAEGLPIGAHDITWTATDANGNVSTAIQKIYVQYDFCGGFMQPLVAGKVYKRRNTLPVKFQLCYADGGLVSDANATLGVQQLSGGEPVGEPLEIISTSNADTGNNFRFSSDKYIYNLEVSSIAAGNYRLSVNLNDGSALKTIDIGLK